jgi:hypothetical protein
MAAVDVAGLAELTDSFLGGSDPRLSRSAMMDVPS